MRGGAVSVLFLVAGLLPALVTPGLAQDRVRKGKKKKASAPAFTNLQIDTWGRLGKERRGEDGVFDLTYFKTDERGKRRSVKARVKIQEATPLWLDRRIKMTQLEGGKSVWAFGKAVARDVKDENGFDYGKDR